MTERVPVLVAGAGPAGLTAARLLASRHVPVVVCEQRKQVGGLARTEIHRGFRFDIGGHRFLTLLPEVQQLWTDTLGEDFLTVVRLSRIFYQGRFLSYPLTLPSVVKTVGAREALRIVASWTSAQANGRRIADQSFEQWMTSRFGERLYRSFFKAYTEKIWGIPRAPRSAPTGPPSALRASRCARWSPMRCLAVAGRRPRWPASSTTQDWGPDRCGSDSPT